jgi:hypothetical protein
MTDAPENSKVPGDGSHQDVSPSIPYSVDVAAAKEEFNALSRQLSQRSEILPSGATTRAASDVEKGDSEEAPFDLREYLSSSNDAQQQAGIKVRVLFLHRLALNSPFFSTRYAFIAWDRTVFEQFIPARRCYVG